MKAKFDKIMSNFIEDSKSNATKSDDEKISEFKNKNFENNVNRLIKKNSQ